MLKSIIDHDRDQIFACDRLTMHLQAVRVEAAAAWRHGYTNADLAALRWYQARVNEGIAAIVATNRHAATLIKHL